VLRTFSVRAQKKRHFYFILTQKYSDDYTAEGIENHFISPSSNTQFEQGWQASSTYETEPTTCAYIKRNHQCMEFTQVGKTTLAQLGDVQDGRMTVSVTDVVTEPRVWMGSERTPVVVFLATQVLRRTLEHHVRLIAWW